MKYANVHDLLFGAASDAKAAFEYNEGKPNHMRISRVGQPLVSLLLEDFVFAKLPSLPKPTLTEKQHNQALVKQKMAQATGYLFEQMVIDILKQKPDLKVVPQHKVKVGSLSGTCDILLINEKEARATVVECKALKYSTKKQACSKALFADHITGYLSQLAVYRRGIEQEFASYAVDAFWMVWCKGSADSESDSSPALFKVPFSESKADPNAVVEAALHKCLGYSLFQMCYEEKDFSKCLSALPLNTLPLKDPFFSGWSNTCSAHYSPWSKLLLDESGVPWDDYKENLTLMLKVCLSDDAQAKDKLLQLIQEH